MDFRAKAHRQKHSLGEIIIKKRTRAPFDSPGFYTLFFPRDVLLTMCPNVLYPCNELKDGF